MINNKYIKKTSKILRIDPELFLKDCESMTIAKLALKHDLSTPSVWRLQKKLKAPKKPRFEDLDQQEFLNDVNTYAHRELTVKYNVSSRTLSRWQKRVRQDF